MIRNKPKVRKKYTLLFLIASMILLPVVMRVDFAKAQPYIKNPDALINVVPSGPSTFEPTWAWDFQSIEVMASCYDRLINYDRENVDIYIPNLAEEVPTLENGGISPDGLTYRFHIRSGVTFADGAPLTAEDVEYSFERAIVRDPDWGPVFLLIEPLLGVPSTRDGSGGFTVTFEDIDNAVVVEGEHLVFHLTKPYAPFMALLASWFSSVVSKQWCIANGDWPGTAGTWQDYNNLYDSPLHTTTMGSGPFKLESWTSEQVMLTRNDLYWRGPAKLERVIFKVVYYADEAVQMLINGDADMSYVPSYLYSELDATEGIRVFRNLPTMVIFLYYFNYAIPEYSPFIGSGVLDGEGIPPDFFTDIDVRKAFAYAIDYEGIINDLYLGNAIQPASPVIEGSPFHNPDQPKYTFDLSKAEEHLMMAWGGQVWENGFSFSLPYWSGSSAAYALAEMVKNNIESLNPGFHMDLVPVPFYMLFSRQLPFYFAGWGADYFDPDSFVRPMLHSAVPFGDAYLTGYSDAYVDYLIDAGVSTVDAAERRAIYYELQSLYHDDVIGIPFAQPLGRHYERDWVQGWYHNPIATTDFYSLWKALPASVDNEPETINVKCEGKWISLYIELPYEIHPEEIDLSTVLLKYGDQSQSAETDPKFDFVTDPSVYIVDHDENGILERLVKIDRAAFIRDLGITSGEIELVVEGELTDGTPFVAWATAKILK